MEKCRYIRQKLKSIWAKFKGSRICLWYNKVYGKLIHILYVGKWMPTLMAYGGIHILILILLFCQSAYMWRELNKNNITSYNQIIYCFYGDTLQNYHINYLNFEKDMRRRPGTFYNVNDISYSYGFEKNKSIEGKLKTKEIKFKNFKGETDLISKVRYITCNNIEDTISHRTKNNFDYQNNRLYRYEYKSNHERYYYDMSFLEDTTHVFKHVTHAQDHLIEWDEQKPCFSFWIGFMMENYGNLKDGSVIRIKFNDISKDITRDGYRRPLTVEKVLPEPTSFSLKEIVYEGRQLEEVLKQGGIYISGVDPEKKEIVEKQNLRSTVLLGTIIAFMLDVIVRLFIKWRKLKDYK